MNRFWGHVIRPLAEAIEARVICEVGSEYGALSAKLVSYCEEVDGVVHVIEPSPRYDPGEWRARHGERFIFHRAISLDVLGDLHDLDLLLIDGDHNWHTVLNELRTVDRNAVPPLVILHDVGWPYGRRDLYYNPDVIPAERRQPYAREGMHPDSEALTPKGMNWGLANARCEGGPRNGVMTAVEDFLAASTREWDLATVEGLFGLAVLSPPERLTAELYKALAHLSSTDFLLDHIRALERARIDLELERAQAAHQVRGGIRGAFSRLRRS
jgi:Methyltransferase domain